MKKAMKKLLAALLAAAMLCALAVPALAATSSGNTITINGKTAGHTYEAYQVFTGDLSGNVLSNVQFGNGVDSTALLADTDLPASLQGLTTAADLAEKLANSTTEEVNEFAAVVSKHLDSSNKFTSTGSGTTYTIDNVPDGYYFIEDSISGAAEGATYSRYMLKIVGNITIESKDTTVTLDKQIKHNESDTWGVVGDNQIGDTVQFRTITTVPDTTGYTTYKYKIHDTMSVGLTSNVENSTDVTIKINDESGYGSELPASCYTVMTFSDNRTFWVIIDILKAKQSNYIKTGDKLYTYYSGTLNEDAKVYPDGNQDNEAYLVYSNNPYNTSSDGQTPEKKVYDWTFQIDVTKVDGTDSTKTLEGAMFALSKKENLDLKPNNGVPTEGTSDLIKLVNKGNGVYVVADTTADTTYTMTTPQDGKISIKGLDDGTYYLYETKAPEGYNSLSAPVKVVISTRTDSNYGNNGATISDAPTVTVDGTSSTGMAFEVKNNAGATLPGTGGIGTTIFYVVGGGLMIAAAVLLITKKRMENKN